MLLCAGGAHAQRIVRAPSIKSVTGTGAIKGVCAI